jgi:general secretion pathway protein F
MPEAKTATKLKAKPAKAAEGGAKGAFSKDISEIFGKPSDQDLVMFSENLALLLGSGVSLDRALAILAEMSPKRRFRRIVGNVYTRIREGSSLWEGLAAQKGVFPPLFVNMVKAGESGGILDTVLARLAEYLTGVREIKEFLVSAMIYPAVLTLVSAISMVVLLTVVIPKFAGIFTDIGVPLPMSTAILMELGNFMAAWWWAILLGLLGALVGLRQMRRSERGRRMLDRFLMRLPVLGPILFKVEISRFARTMGTLLGNGVSILPALKIVRDVVQNSVFRDRLTKVYDELKGGGSLSRSLSEIDQFPPLAVHMLRVGEETGQLDVMLTKVGDVYDKELKQAIKKATALVEPIIILGMGLVIGAMVISMLMAIFSVNEAGF